jgi:nucleoid DNA-binding protein
MAVTQAAALFERVWATLVSGSSARTRVGTFYLQTYPGYEGRNPRTGEIIRVAPKASPFFVASDELTAAAFGPRAGQTHAEGHAFVVSDAAESGATLAASVEVACTDDELAACARALGAELSPDHQVEIAPLGTLVVRGRVEGDKLDVQLRAADALKAALGAG